jgi:large-conductance mechanosensitive channel
VLKRCDGDEKFQEFLSGVKVVDLNVAVIIGSSFGQVVNPLMVDVLTPLICAI